MAQNHIAVIVLQLFTAAAAAPVWATEHEVATFGAVLDDCYASAETTKALTACIGTMSTTCMEEQDGGQTTLGMSACLSGETQVWDKYLNAEYKATRASMKAADADEAEYFPEFARRVETLLAAQRAWIAFRDAECDLAYAEWGAGSMRNIAYGDCRMQMTAKRTIRLRDMRKAFE